MEELLFYEEFIKKREAKKTWVQYWAVLRGRKIYLYVSKDCNHGDFCEVILLSSGSRCILLKRRTYSFRFRLSTSDQIYYFKCDSNLQRHRWVHMIYLAISGETPELPPNHINMKCCLKVDSQLIEHNNSTKLEGSNMQKIFEKNELIEEASEEIEDVTSCRSFGDERSTSNNKDNNDTDVAIFTESLMNIKENKEDRHSKCGATEKDNKTNPIYAEIVSTIETQEVVSSLPPAKQTWSRNFTFGGSFRKSSKKGCFSLEKESRNINRNDSVVMSPRSVDGAKTSHSPRFSMDNPAFTFDDTEENAKTSSSLESSQLQRVINVSPYVNE